VRNLSILLGLRQLATLFDVDPGRRGLKSYIAGRLMRLGEALAKRYTPIRVSKRRKGEK